MVRVQGIIRNSVRRILGNRDVQGRKCSFFVCSRGNVGMSTYCCSRCSLVKFFFFLQFLPFLLLLLLLAPLDVFFFFLPTLAK